MEQNALNAQSSREEWLSRFCLPLLRWYERSARVLPWREEPTPYRVWVSEIMLQQTRVSAVLPYFERFLRRCPMSPPWPGQTPRRSASSGRVSGTTAGYATCSAPRR